MTCRPKALKREGGGQNVSVGPTFFGEKRGVHDFCLPFEEGVLMVFGFQFFCLIKNSSGPQIRYVKKSCLRPLTKLLPSGKSAENYEWTRGSKSGTQISENETRKNIV